MASPTYYQSQALRCLLLSRSTIDPKARLWLTDMASYYATKAKAPAQHCIPAPRLSGNIVRASRSSLGDLGPMASD